MSDTPGIEPYALPGSVVSGELIEASWGNDVVQSIATLAARRPYMFQIFNTAVMHPTTPAAWTNYGVGSFTLPSTFPSWDTMVTVYTSMASTGGGYCRLVAGLNDAQHPYGEGYAVHNSGATVELSHAVKTVLGPGTYTVHAFGMPQNGGDIGIAHAAIIAWPNATTLEP